MPSIASQYDQVQQQITKAAAKYNRTPNEIHLIAVSKTRTADEIRECWQLGQKAFGENYWQEAKPKLSALQDLPIEWHFIGAIQSNKTKVIAQHFDYVHSVDQISILKKLNDHRQIDRKPLKVFIQVNISDEPQKGGVLPNEVEDIVQFATNLKRIELVGLMGMCAENISFEEQLQTFKKLKDCQTQLNQKGYNLKNLSMGMTEDLEAAIAMGSTYIRIGTGIFGHRQ